MSNSDRIYAAIDGALTDAERREFEADCVSDAELRRAYCEAALLHGQLVAAADDLPQLLEPAPASDRSFLRHLPWAAMAAVLTAGFMTLWQNHTDDTVATLIEAKDCRWAASELPTIEGARLRPGRLALVEGIATLRFESGAELTLEAPTTLDIRSAMDCRLIEGSLVADVPESAHGFTVQTEQMDVVDLGTRFGLTTNEIGNAHVFVFEGEIDVERADEETRRLTTGKSMHIGGAIDSANEVRRSPLPLVSEDGWIARIPLRDAYTRNGDAHGSTGKQPLLMVKHTELEPTNQRRAFLTFDLSGVKTLSDAELLLEIETSGLGFSALVPDSSFALYGLQDDAQDNWSEEGLRWTNAPDPETASMQYLAEFEIPRGSNAGIARISSPALTEFLNSDENREATLVLIRTTGEMDSQGLVHAFASREHPTSRPPTLRLKTSS